MEYVVNIHGVEMEKDSLERIVKKFSLPVTMMVFSSIDSAIVEKYDSFGFAITSKNSIQNAHRFKKESLVEVEKCSENAKKFMDGLINSDKNLLVDSSVPQIFGGDVFGFLSQVAQIDSAYGNIESIRVSNFFLYKNKEGKERLGIQYETERQKIELTHAISLFIDVDTHKVVGFEL